MRNVKINIQIAKQLYLDGKSCQQIAEKLNTTKFVILSRLKKHGVSLRKSGRQRESVKGRRFGSLKVLKALEKKDTGKKLYYICQCDCGNFTNSTASQLLRGKRMCWNCRNVFISNDKWRGCGEISGEFWNKTMKSAAIRNIKFNITIEDCWSLFLKQKRKCALSGVDLTFYREHVNRQKITASLDRIDSLDSYHINNVQWVHKVVNNMKMDLPEEEFILWCKLITENKSDTTRFKKQKTN
jgi:hypothetical protein